MKLVIFGLTITSSWGNGHATLWRGLIRALARGGHRVVFFERDVRYYAEHRDLDELPGAEIVLYSDWDEARPAARRHLRDADVGLVTSYCPDGIAATDELMAAPSIRRLFYDLDTPVTLQRLENGESVPYIGNRGLCDFDLVLSFTGGSALSELKTRLGAPRVAPLYGSVDPEVHQPAPRRDAFQADLSYLGTYAPDRQSALERFFIEPARLRPDRRFVLAGAQYPPDFPWTGNIFFVRHLSPADHPSFFSSSALTLNITREAMARMGFCPSGRLFEAAACGVPIVSDWWEGIDEFFEPGAEIQAVSSTEEVLAALDASPEQLQRMALAGRERVLAQHTAARRAKRLEELVGELAGDPAHSSAPSVRT